MSAQQKADACTVTAPRHHTASSGRAIFLYKTTSFFLYSSNSRYRLRFSWPTTFYFSPSFFSLYFLFLSRVKMRFQEHTKQIQILYMQKHVTFYCRGEMGRGKPHKDAIIVGEWKTAAPHGICEPGNVPRGPAVRGSERWMLVSMEEWAREAEETSHGRYCCWLMAWGGEIPPVISPAISARVFVGLGSNLLRNFSFLSAVSSRGRTTAQNTLRCAFFGGFSDLQEHRMLGLSFK